MIGNGIKRYEDISLKKQIFGDLFTSTSWGIEA